MNYSIKFKFHIFTVTPGFPQVTPRIPPTPRFFREFFSKTSPLRRHELEALEMMRLGRPRGWLSFNPGWKICSSKWVPLPQSFGVKFSKDIWSCHHLEDDFPFEMVPFEVTCSFSIRSFWGSFLGRWLFQEQFLLLNFGWHIHPKIATWKGGNCL